MKVRISRRCALVWVGVGAATSLTGCSSMFSRKPHAPSENGATVVQTAPDPIRIIYRTRTDRLNIAGAHLPHCSIAELKIAYPHPGVKALTCFGQLQTIPCSASATPFPERGVSGSLASLFADDTPDSAVPPPAQWTGDIALWEIEAIITSLEKLNFFRKQRTVLTAEVFLSVETAKHAVGKKYRPVAELDALVVRLAQSNASSQSTTDDANHQPPSVAGGLARLPAF